MSAAIYFYCFADELCSAPGVLINVASEAPVTDIHLTESCKNFICAVIIIFSDVAL